MSEDSQNNGFDQLRSSPCSLPFAHPDYVPPTSKQVSMVIKGSGLSQKRTALLTGVKYNDKGSTIVRRWQTDESHKEHRKIPYSAWRILVEYCGISSTKETIDLFHNKGKPR